MCKEIPIAFICDDNFVMQTSVAITSLLKNKAPSTRYRIHVVMAECSGSSEAVFQQFPNVEITHATLQGYRGINQLAHISQACLLKFNICDLLPQHDKLLYMDGDIIVREDLTYLYDIDLGEYYAAATPLGISENGYVNAGVMLFNAKKMREDDMGNKLVAHRRSLGDRASMDQQTFNQCLSNQMGRFPLRYNCVPYRIHETVKSYSLGKLNQQNNSDYATEKALLRDAAIIHFASNNKPWNYSFLPFADEWIGYYRQSPFGNVPLYRKNKLQFRLSSIRKTGLAAYLKNMFAKKMNPDKFRKEWDGQSD